MNDAELLDRFVRDGSQEAFRELVARHTNLVYASARQRLRDLHAAQDVTQAVFLVLAQQAKDLSLRVSLSSWLYRVTQHTCAMYQRRERRRKEREMRLSAEQPPTVPDRANTVWEELEPHLAGALDALSAADREAVLLRYYRQASHRQIAEQFRISEDTAEKRVNRALDKLRKIFAKQGVTLSAVALTGALTASASATPTGLAGVVSQAVLAGGGGTLAATETALLAKGALHAMFISKLKTAALVTTACAVVTGAGVVVATQRPPGNSSPPIGAGGTTGVTRVATTTPSASSAAVSSDAETCAGPWLRRAAREAAGIGDTSEKKLWLLGGIANQWAAAGNVAEFRAAIAALEQAERAAGQTNLNITAMFRYSGTQDLIRQLVRQGRVDEARDLCGLVRGEPFRGGTSYETGLKQVLAQTLAEAGKLSEAQAIAGNLTGEAAASVAYAIAMGLAKTGKTVEAAKSVNPALRNSIYMALVRTQTAQGDVAGAKRTIQDLPAEAQEEAWNAVFAQQLRQQDVRGAKESLAAIKSPAKRQLHYLDLCFAQIQKGDLAGAQATALEMVGQSQELGAFNLVAIEMIKRGDETGAVAFREKISPKLRDRAAKDYRYYLVKAAAEAGDAQRAVRHLEELPAAERNYTLYLSVATALHQAQDVAGARQYFQLAKAEAGDRLHRSLAFQMAQAGAVDEVVQLARGLTNAQAQAEALAGAVNGCVQAGSLERAWAVIGLMPGDSQRVAAAATAAGLAMRKGRQAELSAWIDALPGAWEKAQACLAAAQSCPLLTSAEAARPAAGGDPGKVFKPIDPSQPGFYADGKWSYAYEPRQGTLKYDGRDLPAAQPGDYILTPWGWMQWQNGTWLPVAEKPATGTQLPDPAR